MSYNTIKQGSIVGWYLLLNAIINMNEIVNKFVLPGDKFMPEMHLKQPRFT